jgi:hypothetical protein
VFNQSIRGGDKAFKAYVLDEAGYEWYGDEYKRKSRTLHREILVDFDGKDGKTHKRKVLVDQRQIVFYSEKYAVRSRALREAALKEEKYDGYYAIVTNLFDEGENKGKFSDVQIIDIYRGLWRIEDSFGVTTGELEARPVFLSRKERIKAHFLICYIALVVVRLIQKRTGCAYSPEKLIGAMNNISCSHEGGNLYLFDYRSDIADSLDKAFGIDFSMLRLTRADIKKIWEP